MNIDELTIKEARELARMFGAASADAGPWRIGQAYMIRTVTHYFVGRLEAVGPQELVLSGAAWVADTGRWAAFLAAPDTVREVEPYPDGALVLVGRGAIIDAVVWPHALLRAVK